MNGTLKIIASAIVILGCGYTGLLFASRFNARVKQIEQFRLALEQMSFSIGFLKLPVAEALSGVAKSRSGAVGKVLMSASDEIRGEGTSPSAAFERAVLKNRDDLCMDEDDFDILSEFAMSLGRGDADGELRNINAACARLKIAQVTAQGICERQGKMWRGLGFLLGIFLVVILF